MMEQAQQRIRLALMVVMDSGAVALCLFFALMGDNLVLLIGYCLAAIIVAVLTIAYWRGWDPARYLAVMLVTLLVGLALGDQYLVSGLAFEIFLPAVCALLLLEAGWVFASGIAVLAIILLRSGGVTLYALPENAILYALVVCGMVLSRISTAQVERALHANERMFRAIFKRSGMGIALSDISGTLLMANPAFARMLGYTEQELARRNFYDLSHPDDVEREREHMKQSLTQPEQTTFNFEKRYIRKDGEAIWVNLTASFIADESGAPRYGLGLAEDITERKRAAAALAESELRLRRLTDNMLDMIVQVDSDNTIRYISPSCRPVLGYAPEDLIDRPILAYVHPDDLTIEAEIAPMLRAGRHSVPVEMRARHADGTYVWLELVGSRLYDPQGRIEGAILTCRDITQRRKLEEQLRQSQKLHALGQLAGGVAHDFNNLLTVIDGYTQLLLYNPASAGMCNELEQIQYASRRATNLTRRLLAFSRQEVLDVRVLDLNAVIIGMLAMLKRLIGDHILLQTNLQSDLGTIKADAGQIEQILLNLAVNARDAMEYGGTLWIETMNMSADLLPDPTAQSYVCLRVRDSGIGMDAATRAQIFEPFFTTKLYGEGTGLGLAIVQGIVQQYGGQIRVESAPGDGTCFEILLPQSRDTTASTQSLTVGSVAVGNGETILLAEDNRALRTLTRRMLEEGGYRVIETDSKQAAALAAAHAESIRLLLTDIAMPYLNGYELAAQLRAAHPHLRILFMSGHADAVLNAERIAEFGGEFLPKPFTLNTLLQRVQHILAATPQPPIDTQPLMRAVGDSLAPTERMNPD